MKKFLLTSALIAASLFSFAQTAVPNADFENWEDATTCDGQVPTSYESASDLIAGQGFPCPDATGITKSSTKYSGDYALEITSRIASEQALNNSVVLFDDFTGRPAKLVGYTKFTKGGTDTLGITVALGNDASEDDDAIGSGQITISASQNGYTKFEIPLIYDKNNTTTINALAIYIEIGNKAGQSSESTIALIDAFSFVYDTPTATISYQSASSINVFAANKTINFSENVSDVHVVDMVGASKMQETASTKTVNAAALNTGMYIVTYKYNDNYFSKKIVLE